MNKKLIFLVVAAIVIVIFGGLVKNGRQKPEGPTLRTPKGPTLGLEIQAGNALAETNPSREYITLTPLAPLKIRGVGGIMISGWTVESSRGEKFVIGDGVDIFEQGKINTLSPVNLPPGAIAYLISGESPLGVSFRENACSGFLAERQEFAPPLLLPPSEFADYPSCFTAKRGESGFFKSVWYVYLNSDHELWQGPLEHIKIYNATGKLVYFSFLFDRQEL